MFSSSVLTAAAAVLELARAQNIALIAAESCTGGLVAGALTSVAGSSDVVLGGIVAYANEAKMELLGVPEALIAEHGAVSETVALAMSEGAVLAGRHIAASGKGIVAIAITGIAGPGGGTKDKPVGTVHIAARYHPSGKVLHEKLALKGDRDAVREQSVAAALRVLLHVLQSG